MLFAPDSTGGAYEFKLRCSPDLIVGSSLSSSRPSANGNTAQCYTLRGRGVAMAIPSVCLSDMRYSGHIGWNSWKIISLLISLTFRLSVDTNITDLLQSELNTPKF